MAKNTDPKKRPQPVYLWIPSWLCRPDITGPLGSALFTLMGLWSFAPLNEVGRQKVWPTRAALAERLGRPIKTVDRHLAALTKAGMIERYQEFERRGWWLEWRGGPPDPADIGPAIPRPIGPRSRERSALDSADQKPSILGHAIVQDQTTINQEIDARDPQPSIQGNYKQPSTPRIGGLSPEVMDAITRHPIAGASRAWDQRWQGWLATAVEEHSLEAADVVALLDAWAAETDRLKAAGRLDESIRAKTWWTLAELWWSPARAWRLATLQRTRGRAVEAGPAIEPGPASDALERMLREGRA